MIDPGHGGRDPGAIANGLHEEDVTLAIARQLTPILAAEGARVVLTRNSDENIVPGGSTNADLQARVRIAQQAHADAFVSIHGNELADPNYSGATTYSGTACGYYSGAKLTPVEVGRAYSLAKRVQAALVSRTHEVDRGSKTMPFWVLGNASIPSILVETGFLSNKAEAAKLANPGYQHLVADAISDGVGSFFASGDPAGSPAAPAAAMAGCGFTPAPKPAAAQPRPSGPWVETYLPAPLLGGADPRAKVFNMLPPFSFLQVLAQRDHYLYVFNPLTHGPGYVEAAKVGPSGPPPAAASAKAFQPYWVESFRRTTVWSGTDAHAHAFGTLPSWQFFQVLATSSGSRFQVRVAATGGLGFVDRANVGPSGPPPARPAPRAKVVKRA